MAQRYEKLKVAGRSMNKHRVLMERHLGRPLGAGEVVHHVNHDRYDNRIENLAVLTHQEHSALHNQKHQLTKVCQVCGTVFEPKPTKRARAKTCSAGCRAEAISAALVAKPSIPPWAKLDHDKADRIRAEHAAGGVTHRQLGERFGVHHSQIGVIVRGNAWVRRAGT